MSRMAAELERRWLDRYLNRELSEIDRDWFESYLLDKPDLLVYLEADTALGDGLRALAAQGELEPLLHPGHGERRRMPMLAAAAAGLLLGICGTLLMTAQTPMPVDVSPPEMLLEVSRGSSSKLIVEAGNPLARVGVISISLPPLATLDSVQWTSADGVSMPLPNARINRDGMLILVLPRAEISGSSLTVELTDQGTPQRQLIELGQLAG